MKTSTLRQQIETTVTMGAILVVAFVTLSVVLVRGMAKDTWERIVAEGPETTRVVGIVTE